VSCIWGAGRDRLRIGRFLAGYLSSGTCDEKVVNSRSTDSPAIDFRSLDRTYENLRFSLQEAKLSAVADLKASTLENVFTNTVTVAPQFSEVISAVSWLISGWVGSSHAPYKTRLLLLF
jgi:hypothetical protein